MIQPGDFVVYTNNGRTCIAIAHSTRIPRAERTFYSGDLKDIGNYKDESHKYFVLIRHDLVDNPEFEYECNELIFLSLSDVVSVTKPATPRKKDGMSAILSDFIPMEYILQSNGQINFFDIATAITNSFAIGAHPNYNRYNRLNRRDFSVSMSGQASKEQLKNAYFAFTTDRISGISVNTHKFKKLDVRSVYWNGVNIATKDRLMTNIGVTGLMSATRALHYITGTRKIAYSIEKALDVFCRDLRKKVLARGINTSNPLFVISTYEAMSKEVHKTIIKSHGVMHEIKSDELREMCNICNCEQW